MSRLRLFLAWLVIAVLPLQGFAAATMLFCGVAPASVSAAAHGHHDHDHDHDHGHDKASHDHAKPDVAKGGDKTDQDKQGHTCAVCASCCHVVAVGSFEPFPPMGDAPRVEPTHPVFRVVTRIASLPDKPPRA